MFHLNWGLHSFGSTWRNSARYTDSDNFKGVHFQILYTHTHTHTHKWLFVIPRTVACQALLSVEFSRQEYWSELPFPSPGDLPNPRTEPGSPALQVDSLSSEPPGKPLYVYMVFSFPFLYLSASLKMHLYQAASPFLSSTITLLLYRRGLIQPKPYVLLDVEASGTPSRGN